VLGRFGAEQLKDKFGTDKMTIRQHYFAMALTQKYEHSTLSEKG
jgi:hypothetical protein